MTETTGIVTDFTDVDRAPDAAWFVRFMDQANALPGYDDIDRGLAAELGDLRDRSVLDVGCGTGDEARGLAARVGPGGRVLGIDLSAAMVEEASRRSARSDLPVGFRVADVHRLGIPEATFDAARAKLVLMHCADVDTAAAEILRVTRPGGRIAVFDYDFDTTTVDHPDRDTTRLLLRAAADGHPAGWSGRQLFRRFSDLGAYDVTVTPRTVLLPYSFVRTSLTGRLADAVEAGDVPLTREQLAAWWRPLEQAEARGRFFASVTGFLLGCTR